MDWTITPASGLLGTLRVPGDKSISHRVALAAALSTGVSTLRGYLDSEDCLNMLKVLGQLGAGVERRGTTVAIKGTGGHCKNPASRLDCGNSGTALRLLAGFTAGLPVACELTGDASLLQRPMGRVVEPLTRMGAHIQALGPGSRAPLRVQGGRLHGMTYAMPMASAQVKSCLLLAGMHAHGKTRIVEPAPTRDHTERLFRALNLPVSVSTDGIDIEGSGGQPLSLKANDWDVPGDVSSAAFWLTGAACLPQGRVTVANVGVNPRRTAVLDVLRRMGAGVRIDARSDDAWEPRADITVEYSGRLEATCIHGDEIPNLIDEIPVLCAAAAQAEGETRVLDAAELRVKESDRIASMLDVLRAFGVPCEDLGDGMSIRGVRHLRGGGSVDSRGDHRIAMAAAIMALAADAPTRILNVDCVATSYPGFHGDLQSLAGCGSCGDASFPGKLQ